jgi:hypothetical protein
MGSLAHDGFDLLYVLSEFLILCCSQQSFMYESHGMSQELTVGEWGGFK